MVRKAGNEKKKTDFCKNESFPGLPLHSPEPCDLVECLSWSKRSKDTPGTCLCSVSCGPDCGSWRPQAACPPGCARMSRLTTTQLTLSWVTWWGAGRTRGGDSRIAQPVLPFLCTSKMSLKIFHFLFIYPKSRFCYCYCCYCCCLFGLFVLQQNEAHGGRQGSKAAHC